MSLKRGLCWFTHALNNGTVILRVSSRLPRCFEVRANCHSSPWGQAVLPSTYYRQGDRSPVGLCDRERGSRILVPNLHPGLHHCRDQELLAGRGGVCVSSVSPSPQPTSRLSFRAQRLFVEWLNERVDEPVSPRAWLSWIQALMTSAGSPRRCSPFKEI